MNAVSGQHVPKTPNDIYGFAQKAILHSIFDKGGLGQKTRHTTPFISNIGYKAMDKGIFRKQGN